jgi:molecular chaperone Hsp33
LTLSVGGKPHITPPFDLPSLKLIMNEFHKFLFEGLPVRGVLVRLSSSWQELLARRSASNQEFAPPVRALLGEMAAAAVLMQGSLQFQGTLILQAYGDGPVKLAVAEVQPDLTFRVTAKVTGEIQPDAGLEAMLNLHGQGRCVITLDPQDKPPGHQPYQGVVGLHGDLGEPLQELNQVLEHYMLHSEQLDTRMILAANDEVAAGLLIQRLPLQGEANLQGNARHEDLIGLDETYNRIALMTSTLTREELLTLDTHSILHRLFWEEPVRLLNTDTLLPKFSCSCSRPRVTSMLKGLGPDEVNSILHEQGHVEIGCEFCGIKYKFDPIDAAELFTPERDQPPSSSIQH